MGIFANFVIQKSMLGIRPEPETDKMRRCVELTDRVVNLANGLLQQQRDLLKTIKRISDEVCDSNEGSLEPQAEHPTYGDKN